MKINLIFITLIQENFIIVNNYKKEKYLEIVLFLGSRIINSRLV